MSKIPYDLTLIKGIAFDVDGVLSPCVVPLGADGLPCRMANLRDGYALKLAADSGLHIAIISGAEGEALEKRFRNLHIPDIYLKAGRKADILKEWMDKNSLSPEEVAFVGDDIPDREALQMVGLGVVPADAAPDLLGMARYVSPARGGYGVARDLLEEILKAQDKWPLTAKAYG